MGLLPNQEYNLVSNEMNPINILDMNTRKYGKACFNK